MKLLRKTHMRLQGIKLVFALFVVTLPCLAESEKAKIVIASFEYNGINCRAYNASLTDFGGVGDGVTSNTKAFQSAISNQVSMVLKDITERPVIEPLPSYGRGRDATTGRFTSLVFGTNLTDVIVTGKNGTIDGQGAFWWQQFHRKKLKYTRPYLIEVMFSDGIQISNLTLLNSPSWNIHPVYSNNIIAQGITIFAPVTSPNTDGINPDSCTNTKIEDCYIVSGDDSVSMKNGWDEYGIKFGWPTKQLVIRRLTCISPFSATIGLGSEMSGGIQDVRAEDITAIQTNSVEALHSK